VKLHGQCLELGPESMGSFPGPACYGLGGDKPTLTDAFVTAGLINPEHFLGGTKHLDMQLARGAIEAGIARPHRISVEEACRAILNCAFDMVTGIIQSASEELEQDLSDHVLFAYGGNGGLFACGVAQRAKLRDVYLFALGAVFSAFGSSAADISHVYERSFHLPLRDGMDIGPLNNLIDEMRNAGLRDLLGEGIKPDPTECSVEMELSQPGKSSISVKLSQLYFTSVEHFRGKLGSDLDNRDLTLELVRLQMKKSISKPPLQRAAAISDSAVVPTGKRAVAYGSVCGEADVYKWESLKPGNRLRGCCILEAENSTYFAPEGWALEIDCYGNAQVTRDNNEAHASASSLQESRSYGPRR